MPLRSRIPLIASELDDKLIEGVADLAQRVADGAQERVPVDSGNLRDAIHVETNGMEVRVVAGSREAFYGHIVENGSVRQPPRPFLVPAFEALRPDLEKIVGESLGDL